MDAPSDRCAVTRAGPCSNRDTATGRRSTPSGSCLVEQGRNHRPILDHVREGFTGCDLAAESEEARPHGVIELRIRHHHVEDWLGLVLDRGPDADGLEQMPCRSGDRRGAQIGGRRRGQRRRAVHPPGPRPRPTMRRPNPVSTRDGQRQAGKTAAGDEDVGLWSYRSLLPGFVRA